MNVPQASSGILELLQDTCEEERTPAFLTGPGILCPMTVTVYDRKTHQTRVVTDAVAPWEWVKGAFFSDEVRAELFGEHYRAESWMRPCRRFIVAAAHGLGEENDLFVEMANELA